METPWPSTLRAKGLDRLRIGFCNFANQVLAAVGAELGRVQALEIDELNSVCITLIGIALQSPNSAMKELSLPYEDDTASSIEKHVVPALRHPNCSLAKLRFFAYDEEHQAAAKMVEDKLRSRCGLFALLQGQQVGQKSPLRRLPVELFRLVGKALS